MASEVAAAAATETTIPCHLHKKRCDKKKIWDKKLTRLQSPVEDDLNSWMILMPWVSGSHAL